MSEAIPDDFLQLVRERLLRQRGDAEVVIHEGDLLLEVPGQPVARLSAYNLWRSIEAFRDTPQSVTAPVDEWVRSALAPKEVPESGEDFAASLRPAVRTKDLVSTMVQNGQEVPILSLIPGVATLLVVDTEHNMRFVDTDTLEQAGIEGPDAFQHALDNFIADLRESLERHGTDGYCMFTGGGHYESSLLLLDSLWDAEEAEMGPIAVAIPARDLCIWAPQSDPEAMSELRAAVADAFERGVSYLLSPWLYTRHDGDWQILESATPKVSDHRVDLLHYDEIDAHTAPDTDPLVRFMGGGLVLGLLDSDDTLIQLDHDAFTEDMNDACETLTRRSRPEVELHDDGVTALTSPDGPAAAFGIMTRLLDHVGEDRILCFPTRGLALAAPPAHVEALRARAIAAYDTGPDPLTVAMFTEPEGVLQPWPAVRVCGDCESELSSETTHCWRCGESALSWLTTRWSVEAIVPALALSTVFWLTGVFTAWISAGGVWLMLFLLGWPTRARRERATRSHAFAELAGSSYRWILPFLLLLVTYQAPGFLRLWTTTLAEEGTSRALTAGLGLNAGLLFAVWATWLEMGWRCGWSTLLPWTATTLRRN